MLKPWYEFKGRVTGVPLENVVQLKLRSHYSNMHQTCKLAHEYGTLLHSPFQIIPLWNVTLKLLGGYPCEKITT